MAILIEDFTTRPLLHLRHALDAFRYGREALGAIITTDARLRAEIAQAKDECLEIESDLEQTLRREEALARVGVGVTPGGGA